ncbi:phage holin [Lactococcus garvieae]|uniref:phage holin n=1 Tax=Lactococcus garvieae TaxID=1363 RepID=UPI0032482F48
MKNKIDAGTVTRTLILALALLNQLLTSTGHAVLQIDDATVTNTVTSLFTIGSAIWAWWKNNSVTQNAIEADKRLSELKKKE